LYQKVGQLQIEVDWLKKDRLSGMSVLEEIKCIDGRNKTLSISRQFYLLQLPRASYYRSRSSFAEGPDNLELYIPAHVQSADFDNIVKDCQKFKDSSSIIIY